jgi:glutamate dehydrogenase
LSAGAWLDQLVELVGADRGDEARTFAKAVPPGYAERTTPEEAAFDLTSALGLERGEEPEVRFAVRPDPTAGPGTFRLRRVGGRPMELSDLLPLMESFGLAVIEAVPQWIECVSGSGRRWHVDDVGVRLRDPVTAASFAPAADAPRLLDALEAIGAGTADADSLNRLVLTSRLGWRQVVVLRAYRRFLAQAGTRWSSAELDDARASYPEVVVALDRYHAARFDPDGRPPGEEEGASEGRARQAVLEQLAEVSHLAQDQMLRLFLGLVDATTRTNAYCHPEPFTRDRALAIQLDSTRVPELPEPRPKIETFAHGPLVEGVHLRFGPIARGGLRWSERPDDFRTEVLDLARAQVKKNAIIVPTGAKGGFVVRGATGPPTPDDVRRAYEVFVGSLLDITDNVVDDTVRHPDRVEAATDDPYLVVAADKGTASFSDLANAISARRDFWLGDAFASGGSRGYDHKALGITARGAWVAVRRHFHQLGVDPQSEPISVAGVGDMSGDVFGNGMLLSHSIELVAAFDHRHVFVDPSPGAEASFVERERLAALGRSSWDDYDRSLLSEGGGIWPRDAKVIELSGAARRALGTDRGELTPPELISVILAAPVDLLWFGGIGTYIRAPDETDAEVGDRANDPVRVTSNQVRARVVAEGGNLGVTQRGRIRYSRRGGRINTDFIDNAAGVATSDREVNLKILLALAVSDGTLTEDDRDTVLASVTSDVATAVLHQVDNSVVALSRAVPRSAVELDAYEDLLVSLESAGLLDRGVEDLPDDEEMATRRAAGAGLIRPELAVLLAYAKSSLVADIEASDVAGDAALLDSVTPSFPPAIVARFAPLITRHRLYPQLVATDVAGEVVDQMGITWAAETASSLGRGTVDVATAFWAARQVLGADLDLEAHHLIVDAVDVVARRYLRRAAPLALGEVIAADGPVARELADGEPGAWAAAARDRLVDMGASPVVAEDLARWVAAADVADVADVARELAGSGVIVGAGEIVAVLHQLDGTAGTPELLTALRSAGEAGGRYPTWHARALEADLRDWRADTVRAVLVEHGRPGTVADALGRWRSGGAFRAADRLRTQLGGEQDLTVAALVLRALPRWG